MNYSPFLNKRSNSRINTRYQLSSKKKNGRIFLVSSLASIAVMTTVVTLLTHNDSLATDQPSNDSVTRIDHLELPEIGYQSEIISKAEVYKEEKASLTLASVDSEQLIEIQNDNLEAIDNTSSLENTVAETNNGLTTQLLVNTLEASQSEAVKNVKVKKTNKETSIVAKVSLEKQPAISTSDSVTSTLSSSVPEIQPSAGRIKTITVKKGDTLSAIFKRQSLSSSSLYKIINSGKAAKKLTRIKPGQTFTLELGDNDDIESLKFTLNKADTLIVNKQDKRYVSHIESKEIEIRQQFTTGTISNSLFAAGSKAGLNSSMIMKVAHIFGWDIDFALDIRKGDSFAVLFEEKYIDGKKIGDGNILSAEFVNNGNVFNAIRYTDDSGHTDYYSENGLSMRKAFLRTPVEFSRISSRFSTGRKHPILNRIRAHKGVDYAASRGTPIKAVGDGKVIFKGRKGGYGRVIILQHGSKYTTLYAHMNAYNKKLRHGSRVKQGQTIGYIGSSGLATGPHLHYEFRVNGVHRNPLTVALPSAAPIAKKYRSDFKATADTMISQLKLRKQETIALNE